MNLETVFIDPNSRKIWENYFTRVSKTIRVLDSVSREETILELQDHLFQSFNEKSAGDEVSNLLLAIEGLGEPEEFLKHVISEKLLRKGVKTLSPRSIFAGLFYRMSGGLKSILSALTFSLGYLLILIFGLMSFIKFFIPENVGLFIWPNGSWALGIINDTIGADEILGYWITPLSLFLAFIIYFLITQILKITLKKE